MSPLHLQGYYDNRYWTMYKLPMFGCTDASQVCAEAALNKVTRFLGASAQEGQPVMGRPCMQHPRRGARGACLLRVPPFILHLRGATGLGTPGL